MGAFPSEARAKLDRHDTTTLIIKGAKVVLSADDHPR